MTHYLTINVRAHEGRYHGDGDEFPSPFRLFQALVAGAGISGPLDEPTKQALAWLESLPDAPIVASPHMARGQAVTMFMPNNDLDKFGGDVRNIAKTRGAQKVWRPRQFDASVPWIYAWPFPNDGAGEPHAATICTLADKLYQLGRGVDMAWAWGEILDEAALAARLVDYRGIVRRPSSGDGLLLACPMKGSFESLRVRHEAARFRSKSNGERVSGLHPDAMFVQKPKPIYRQVAYDSSCARHVFELRSSTDSVRRVAWPLEGASSLVVAAREAAHARLLAVMPNRVLELERHLVGRTPDGSAPVPTDSRVRIIPIPSIGTHYADRAIRRLLVEIPAACPLPREDVRWAFSGAELFDPVSGEVKDIVLVPSSSQDMLRHYGVGSRARLFRSVTPVVLPEKVGHRRSRLAPDSARAQCGLERVNDTSSAGAAVIQALRHAGVTARAASIRLQREPFDGAGARVEPFAAGTRFETRRLWHVEIGFQTPVEGLLAIGDGRFLGLGVMAPVRLVPNAWVFDVEGEIDAAHATRLARALRRATMSRWASAMNTGVLPTWVSGHADDGAAATDPEHLGFACDAPRRRLLVIPPHTLNRRPVRSNEDDQLETLNEALEGLTELRAGVAGLLRLRPRVGLDDDDVLSRASREWVSVTPYVVDRHRRRSDAAQAVREDVIAACQSRGLPIPEEVRVSDVRSIPGRGLSTRIGLRFAVAVTGPILLGRDRYVGGGLFTIAG